MNLKKITPKKNRAQAMVEFAIVLPILLMLLYGLLEAGRLLFIYSSIVTASRQAVRYGSATGEGSTTVPRYQDCDGIRDAAQRVDYLNAFEDDDILIQYDTGPNDPNPVTFCDGSTNNFIPTNNSSRLLVTIDGDYLPIVPRIVGFLERSETSASGPITAQSARTVMVSVSIFVTAPPSNWEPDTSTPTLTFTPSYTPTSTSTATATATDPAIFTSTPTLTRTLTASPTVTITSTRTLTPTITRTPTLTPTPVPPGGCTTNPGTLTLPGNNTMTLTIQNPHAWPLTIGDLFVTWDHDRGHTSGNDKSLILQSVSVGTTDYWNGNLTGPNAGIEPNPPMIIPAGSSITIVFEFHQEYDRSDGSEELTLNLSTNGCENSPPIHVTD